MKKKTIVLLTMILFLSACKVEYNLELKENLLNEEIVYYDLKKEDLIQMSFPILDLDKEEVQLVQGSDKYFNQSYILKDDIYTLNYKASHSLEDFAKDSYINECFDELKLEKKDKLIYIIAYAKELKNECFGDKVKASFTSDYLILNSNADKVAANTHTWNLKNHEDGIEIIIDSSQNYTKANANLTFFSIFKIFLAILIIVLLIVVKIFVKKNVED